MFCSELCAFPTVRHSSSTSGPSGSTALNPRDAVKVLKKSRRQAFDWLALVKPDGRFRSCGGGGSGDGRSGWGIKKKGKKAKGKKAKGKKKNKSHNSGNEIPDRLTVTTVKDMFLLSDEDLFEINVIELTNPKNENFPFMRLCDTAQVVEKAYVKYGGADGFLQMALAAKRKTSKAKLLEQPAWVANDDANHEEKNRPEEQEAKPVPEYILPDDDSDKSIEDMFSMRVKLHFLLQFTTYPVLRDERLALKLWIDRFPTLEAAQKFPYLPDSMRRLVENFSFATTSFDRVQKRLPNFSVLWDTMELQEQDATARERAKGYIRQGIPNRAECDLLDAFLRNPSQDLEPFPFLFLYEWTPSTMVGQGDAVFANAQGGLVVVEAKAKSSKSHVTRQSLFYQQRLMEEYPHASVSAAILTTDGFDWIERAPSESSAKPTRRTDRTTTSLRAQNPTTQESGRDEEKSVTEPEMDKDSGVSVPFAMLAPSRIDQLESMVVEKEIKPLLRFYGLKVSGRKSELIERVYQHELNDGIAGGF